MKIKPEHYAHIKSAIATVSESIPMRRARLIELYPAQYGPNGKGDIEMRLRWDLLRECVPSQWVCDNIYRDGMNGPDTGINDTHIDTVLRSIMREINTANAGK